jgi:hypothetical protein
MTADRIRFTLSAAEIRQLGTLVEEFVGLLREPDAALARSLAPSAYPDDHEADAAFRAATSDDLRRRREQDADRVLADLAGAGDPGRARSGRGTRALIIDPEGAAAWMRTLAALRRALATRLDELGADGLDPDDAAHLVYEWLGYRLDALVRAVEGA